MKIVIYTAITNGYDSLKEPCPIPGVDYICFSDRMIKSNIWKVRVMKIPRIDKLVKIKPHLFLSEYDMGIWVDAGLKMEQDFSILVEECKKLGNLALFAHPYKRTLKEEVDLCIKQRKGNKEKLLIQLDNYKNYSEEKVYACGFLARRHNSIDVIKLMEKWWEELQKHTYRDQISFCYLVNKLNMEFDIIEENILSSKWLKFTKHLKRYKP